MLILQFEFLQSFLCYLMASCGDMTLKIATQRTVLCKWTVPAQCLLGKNYNILPHVVPCFQNYKTTKNFFISHVCNIAEGSIL